MAIFWHAMANRQQFVKQMTPVQRLKLRKRKRGNSFVWQPCDENSFSSRDSSLDLKGLCAKKRLPCRSLEKESLKKVNRRKRSRIWHEASRRSPSPLEYVSFRNVLSLLCHINRTDFNVFRWHRKLGNEDVHLSRSSS